MMPQRYRTGWAGVLFRKRRNGRWVQEVLRGGSLRGAPRFQTEHEGGVLMGVSRVQAVTPKLVKLSTTGVDNSAEGAAPTPHLYKPQL